MYSHHFVSGSDEEYFRQPNRSAVQLSDNWVLRFNSLKRLYRLMTQYIIDVLHQPARALDVPDLQAIAKDQDIRAILLLCRMTITIGVQCGNNKNIIDRIQGLKEREQHSIMKAIEQVSACLCSAD